MAPRMVTQAQAQAQVRTALEFYRDKCRVCAGSGLARWRDEDGEQSGQSTCGHCLPARSALWHLDHIRAPSLAETIATPRRQS